VRRADETAPAFVGPTEDCCGRQTLRPGVGAHRLPLFRGLISKERDEPPAGFHQLDADERVRGVERPDDRGVLGWADMFARLDVPDCAALEPQWYLYLAELVSKAGDRG
jgi:hypothetical protein